MRYFHSFTTGCGLLLSLLLSGCAKDSGPTLVEGQVIDSQSRQPVGNLSVQVEQAGRGGGFGGGGFSPLGPSYPTDATGHFRFRFEAASKTTYIVRAASPLGYFTDPIKAPELKAGQKNQHLTVPVLAPAWVRLQLIDELPKNRVVLYFSGYEGQSVDDQLYMPRDTTVIRPLIAGFPYVVYWRITDYQTAAETSFTKDIGVVAPLDTVTVHVAF